MEINYYAVAVCAVLAMVLGWLWYGPLFGKQWMEICGMKGMDEAKRREMQKATMPLYLIQFVLVLFQAWVLAYYIGGWTEVSGLSNGLWVWAAFIMPTVAAASMWNGDAGKVKWSRFLIQAGYQLLLFIAFGLILGAWR